ncbi:MAG: proton-conducting transporter membrane subunit [Clostridia bacterium]|nr:proton-conducting transporter membrane subunit [Clostridia bacterium]
MNPWYLLVPVLLPVISGLLVAFLKPFEGKKARNALTMLTLAVNVGLLIPVLLAPDMSLTLFSLSDNLPIFLHTDTVGRIFAAVMCFVWCMAGAYSFEYMAHEDNQRRYYSFYLITLGVLMALCFSGSIVTFYMFYEFMTLLTVPLVMHTMTKEAVAAGIKYLIYSVIGASLVLLGVFLLSPFVSTFSFAPGGVLDMAKVAGHEGYVLTVSLLMLMGFGAKAGMFPLHGWLPTAHPVAPSPASAVLSGVITKAGVLGNLRLIFFFFGTSFLRGTWVQTTFMVLTLFTVFMGSMLAYREGLLKKRLAWSSVSQVSYILFGLSTMHPLGLIGALLHVVAHALIKNTLFMSAGAIIEKTGKTRVSELDGIGKQMPFVMWCFTFASVGLVGIPPCLGFVSKWYLAQGAMNMTGVASAYMYAGPAVLLVSALLTAGYLFTIFIKGFFPGHGADGKLLFFEKKEPTYVMLVPMLILTVLSVVLGLFPNALIGLFQSVAALIV